MEIAYTAPPRVRDAIASLGRTEDVRFSPDNRRLAVAAFTRNRIVVFDIDLAAIGTGGQVALTGAVELSSSAVNRPHGLDFIDDETLIVCNREGDVAVFKLPVAQIDAQLCEVQPIQVLPADGSGLLRWPGSVSAYQVDRDISAVLLCNNFAHNVTRHLLDRSANCAVRSGDVLLRKWLEIPDGVSVSRDQQWIAVSNHNMHNVLLYENLPSLNPDSDPDGILRCVHYPHGLRFSADGRFIFLADAGAPYVHIYARNGDAWRGVRHPVASIKVMDDALFMRGRGNPQEGGPKGIDIDSGMNVLVITSECQPLAFFDAQAMLEWASAGSPSPKPGAGVAQANNVAIGQAGDDRHAQFRRAQSVLEVRYELAALEEAKLAMARAIRSEAKVVSMKKRASWRLMAPFRRVYRAWRRLRKRSPGDDRDFQEHRPSY